MPHYADGTLAHVGDLVFGKPYNTKQEIVGEIIAITSNADACNCQVAFVLEDKDLFDSAKPAYQLPVAFVHSVYDGPEKGTYTKRVWKLSADYGAIKEFTLVKSAAQSTASLTTTTVGA